MTPSPFLYGLAKCSTCTFPPRSSMGICHVKDSGDWTLIEPTTRLTDSLEHDYRVTLATRPAGEVTVAVRVEDGYGNQAVAKTVLK